MIVPIGDVVLPGDKFHGIPENNKLILGRGIILIKGYPTATKAGVLKHKPPLTYWVDTPDTFFRARKGDHVVGVIKRKLQLVFLVDINETNLALLSLMDFDGATKKNRPDVKVGDAVYAKVTKCSMNSQTEITCLSPNAQKTGIFGKITADGVIFRGHVNYIRRLLSHKCPMLKILGDLIAFEVAIGVNGKTSEETIVLLDIITMGERLSDVNFKEYCIKQLKFLSENKH